MKQYSLQELQSWHEKQIEFLAQSKGLKGKLDLLHAQCHALEKSIEKNTQELNEFLTLINYRETELTQETLRSRYKALQQELVQLKYQLAPHNKVLKHLEQLITIKKLQKAMRANIAFFQYLQQLENELNTIPSLSLDSLEKELDNVAKQSNSKFKLCQNDPAKEIKRRLNNLQQHIQRNDNAKLSLTQELARLKAEKLLFAKKEIAELETQLELLKELIPEADRKSLATLEQEIAEKSTLMATSLEREQAIQQELLTLIQQIEINQTLLEQNKNCLESKKSDSELTNSKNSLQEKNLDLMKEKNRLESEAQMNKAELDALITRYNELLIPENFAAVFNALPKHNKQLTDDILSIFNRYESNNPFNQSKEFRFITFGLEKKLAAIQAEKDELNKMACFYGFLYDCLDLLLEQELRNQITAYLLSNNFIDTDDCKLAYSRLKEQHRFACPTLADLNSCEEKSFDEAFKALSKSVSTLDDPKQIQKGNDLINAIEKSKSSEHFDVKYATTVLTATKNLIENKNDASLQSHYIKLASIPKKGLPDSAIKMIGCMLAFIGALVVGLSVTAIVLSLGGSAAFSYCSGAIGAGLLTMGIGLFCHGRGHGSAKAMVDFADAHNRKSLRA